MEQGHISVRGKMIDDETRCAHYHGQRDIIAIKFYCCNTYYPCFLCHEETADHPARVWPKTEFNQKAILCGKCNTELTIKEYLNTQFICPYCKASYNEGCQRHYHLYFDETETEK